eukprot:TRINITY_DN10087_c0_g1_i1.p1 TRINITY_DN10087_c0_g1~~TRINITY_DN10087_c0_g1_i1.p1  ORF type:complete len:1269 (-),score=288.30 TRINITY_DN10087_c0_g1_i1:122-3928(-)
MAGTGRLLSASRVLGATHGRQATDAGDEAFPSSAFLGFHQQQASRVLDAGRQPAHASNGFDATAPGLRQQQVSAELQRLAELSRLKWELDHVQPGKVSQENGMSTLTSDMAQDMPPTLLAQSPPSRSPATCSATEQRSTGRMLNTPAHNIQPTSESKLPSGSGNSWPVDLSSPQTRSNHPAARRTLAKELTPSEASVSVEQEDAPPPTDQLEESEEDDSWERVLREGLERQLRQLEVDKRRAERRAAVPQQAYWRFRREQSKSEKHVEAELAEARKELATAEQKLAASRTLTEAPGRMDALLENVRSEILQVQSKSEHSSQDSTATMEELKNNLEDHHQKSRAIEDMVASAQHRHSCLEDRLEARKQELASEEDVSKNLETEIGLVRHRLAEHANAEAASPTNTALTAEAELQVSAKTKRNKEMADELVVAKDEERILGTSISRARNELARMQASSEAFCEAIRLKDEAAHEAAHHQVTKHLHDLRQECREVRAELQTMSEVEENDAADDKGLLLAATETVRLVLQQHEFLQDKVLEGSARHLAPASAPQALPDDAVTVAEVDSHAEKIRQFDALRKAEVEQSDDVFNEDMAALKDKMREAQESHQVASIGLWRSELARWRVELDLWRLRAELALQLRESSSSAVGAAQLSAAEDGCRQAELRAEALEDAAKQGMHHSMDANDAMNSFQTSKKPASPTHSSLVPPASVSKLIREACFFEVEAIKAEDETASLLRQCNKVEEVCALRASEFKALCQVRNASEELLQHCNAIESSVRDLTKQEQQLKKEERKAVCTDDLRARLRSEAASTHRAWERGEETAILHALQASQVDNDEALAMLEGKFEAHAADLNAEHRLGMQLQIVQNQHEEESEIQAQILEDLAIRARRSCEMQEAYCNKAKEVELLFTRRTTTKTKLEPIKAAQADEQHSLAEATAALERLRSERAETSAASRAQAGQFFMLRRHIAAAEKLAQERRQEMAEILDNDDAALRLAHQDHMEAAQAAQHAVEFLADALLALGSARQELRCEKYAHDETMQELESLHRHEKEASKRAADKFSVARENNTALCHEFRECLLSTENNIHALRQSCETIDVEIQFGKRMQIAGSGTDPQQTANGRADSFRESPMCLREKPEEAELENLTSLLGSLRVQAAERSTELQETAALVAHWREMVQLDEAELEQILADVSQAKSQQENSALGEWNKYRQLPVWQIHSASLNVESLSNHLPTGSIESSPPCSEITGCAPSIQQDDIQERVDERVDHQRLRNE